MEVGSESGPRLSRLPAVLHRVGTGLALTGRPADLEWDVDPPAKIKRGGGRSSLNGVNVPATLAKIQAFPGRGCRVITEWHGVLSGNQLAYRFREAVAYSPEWEITARLGWVYIRYVPRREP